MKEFIKLTNREGLRITVKRSEIVMFHKFKEEYAEQWWWSKKRKNQYKEKNQDIRTFMWLSHRIYLKVKEPVELIESMLGLTNTK